jgi:hypothetical protein
MAGRSRSELLELVGPPSLVCLAVAFGLFCLRADADVVAYPDDSAMHSQMVRYATAQLRLGHFPIDGWYALLGLGSPHLQNYQGLPATLTGIVGLVVGPNVAYAWSLYLLVCLFPISVYWGARLLGFGRWTAAASSLVAPLLSSAAGVGYEWASYIWIGYGVWTQEWAMLVMPLAWGFTWQAIEYKKHRVAAAVSIALVLSLHFLSGYLAALPLLVFPFVRPGQLLKRIGRSAQVAIGTVMLTLWVTVPVIARRNYTAVNEFAQHAFYADSFGARKILGWLVHGQLFDDHRFPIVTILLTAGLVYSLRNVRRDIRCRAILVLWVVCLVAFFGRPTLGFLYALVPGAKNLFLRRLVMGVDLSTILLAGVGATALAKVVVRLLSRRSVALADGLLLRVVAVVALLGALAAAWTQLSSYAAANARDISYQRSVDSTQGHDVNLLVDEVKRLGGGRVYAGLFTDWGEHFYVGYVPVFIYLATQNVDEVGFTLRTESLMSNPEAYFDWHAPIDYSMFGVKYLIVPAGIKPPIKATLLKTEGPYSLWTVPGVSYFQVVATTGTIAENDADVGRVTASLVRAYGQPPGRYLTVSFDGHPAPPATEPFARTTGSPGKVLAQHDDLYQGRASATIFAHRTSVVVLSASYDPGWTVTVDGRPARTEMVTPALVAVKVGPGLHRVAFVWQAYGGYPELGTLSAVTFLVLVAGLPLWRRRRSRRSTRAGGAAERGSRRSTRAGGAVEPSSR